MAINQEKKSNRLLGNRRFTSADLNTSQEAFTSVLDLQASEIYTQGDLIPSSALQEYLLRHSKLPKAKEIGNIIYKVLASGNPIFDEKVLDDWRTSLDELQMTVPQLFDASEKTFVLFLVWWVIVSWLMSQRLGFHFSYH